MSFVASINFIAFIAVIVSLIALVRGWKRVLPYDIKLLLIELLGLTLFHHFSNILEWGGISNVLDPFEDSLELLIPILWFMLIYSYLKELTTHDLKTSERALRKSEAKFRLLADHTFDWEYWIDPAGNYIYSSSSCKRITGYSPEEFKSNPELLFEIVKPGYVKKVFHHYHDENNKDTSAFSMEFPIITKTGEECWLEHNCNPVFDDQGNYAGRRGNNRDITERKRAEIERDRLMQAIEQAAETILITDSKGTIQYANPVFERITGYTCQEAIGQNPRILKSGKHNNAFYKEMWVKLMHGETWSGRMINKRKDGRLFTEEVVISPVLDVSGRTVNYVAVKRDITKEIKLKEQFIQAQKMESVGRLAGGVAHDYNNALSVIMGFTELAMEEVDPAGQLHTNLNQILKATRRAAGITRQLLAFARKQTISPKVLDLNKNVESMLKMLRRLIGEDIDLAWLPGSSLWSVKMDPSQTDQILANLCVNARDAIEGVGKVTIETDTRVFDATYCADHPGFVPGDFVLLALSDNGCGMDKEILDNIFEPFFTTKDVDKGTGLGLSTVYGIVKQNNGFINVYSELGEGTTIKIYLPRHDGQAARIQRESLVEIPPGSGETVLLVEDDLSILKLTKKILHGLGYTVLTAGTPGHAMDLVKEYTGRIHLLLTDVIMPEMNGCTLAERLQPLCPDLKYVFMSGYTTNVIARHGILDKGICFIQKPFSRRGLAKIVRKALDENKN